MKHVKGLNKRLFRIISLALLLALVLTSISPGIARADPGPGDFTCKIKASGGDYNKLSDWEAAIQSDLTSSASKVFSVSSIANGGIADGKACTGLTSGATGTFKHLLADQSKCYIVVCSGIFQSGETIKQDDDASKTVTISDAGVQIGAAIAECYAMQDTTAVTINGWTTNSTHYIKIYTPTSERHDGKWNTSKYRLEVTNNYGIVVSEEFVRIEGLQVKLTNSSGNDHYAIHLTNVCGAELRVSHCIRADSHFAITSFRR